MSYGAAAKQAARFREAEVLSATPGQLVLILYDHLLLNLRRARLVPREDAMARSDALERARATLTELLVTVDRDRGGAIAVHLVSLYSFLLGELSVLGVKPDLARIDRIITMVTDLRQAFALAIEQAPAAVAAS
jgi:flagellar protein FliS